MKPVTSNDYNLRLNLPQASVSVVEKPNSEVQVRARTLYRIIGIYVKPFPSTKGAGSRVSHLLLPWVENAPKLLRFLPTPIGSKA